MSLVENLIALGYKLKREGGGNFRVIGYSGLIIKGEQWFQHSTGRGGNSSSLMRLLQEPQTWIRSTESIDSRASADSVTKKKGLQFGEKLMDVDEYSIRYLTDKRGLDLELIKQLIEHKLLRQDYHQNLCFCGYDKNGKLQCLSRRATRSHQRPQKSESRGSKKKYSFSLRAQFDQADLIVVEGPIDALSVACLEHRRHNKGYWQTHKIASCGANTKTMVERIITWKPPRVWLFFDNDAPGQRMAEDLYRSIASLIDTRVITCQYGKDPNDWLRHVKGLDLS